MSVGCLSSQYDKELSVAIFQSRASSPLVIESEFGRLCDGLLQSLVDLLCWKTRPSEWEWIACLSTGSPGAGLFNIQKLVANAGEGWESNWAAKIQRRLYFNTSEQASWAGLDVASVLSSTPPVHLCLLQTYLLLGQQRDHSRR